MRVQNTGIVTTISVFKERATKRKRRGRRPLEDEAVLDAGPLHATVERNNHISVPPIVSGAVLVAGVALLFVGIRQKA